MIEKNDNKNQYVYKKRALDFLKQDAIDKSVQFSQQDQNTLGAKSSLPNSSKNVINLDGEFMPFLNERNHLGQLLSLKNNGDYQSQKNFQEGDKILDSLDKNTSYLKQHLGNIVSAKRIKFISSVMPSPAKVLIERGQFKFFERGAIKVPYAKRPTEDSLLYDKEDFKQDSRNQSLNLSQNNNNQAIRNEEVQIQNENQINELMQKREYIKKIYEKPEMKIINKIIQNNFNDFERESRWHINLDDVNKNIKTINTSQEIKLPKLRLVSNKNSENFALGPGSYQYENFYTNKNAPQITFAHSKRKKENQSQSSLTKDIQFLEIYQRPKKITQNDGYEKSYNQMMKEIERTVQKSIKNHKSELLHPKKHLQINHFDPNFIQEFESDFKEKFKNAKKIISKIRTGLKENIE